MSLQYNRLEQCCAAHFHSCQQFWAAIRCGITTLCAATPNWGPKLLTTMKVGSTTLFKPVMNNIATRFASLRVLA